MGWILVVAAIAVLPFGLGLTRVPWWALGVLPLAFVTLGVISSASEPPNYDMPGFGLMICAVIGGICLVASSLGRLVRWSCIEPRPLPDRPPAWGAPDEPREGSG